MKNKKLMLLAVGAMGAVALGTAGVGTMAWYQASSTASLSYSANDENTIAVTKGSASLGSFTIAVTTASFDDTDICLTNDSGQTFVYTSSGTSQKASSTIPDGSVAIATVTLKVTVTYGGTATSDDAAIKSMFADALGNNDVAITASATGTQAAQVKYTAGASAYTNVSGKNVVKVPKATLLAATFTSKATAELSASANMYIGVSGLESNEGESALELEFTFTPSTVAAA